MQWHRNLLLHNLLTRNRDASKAPIKPNLRTLRCIKTNCTNVFHSKLSLLEMEKALEIQFLQSLHAGVQLEFSFHFIASNARTASSFFNQSPFFPSSPSTQQLPRQLCCWIHPGDQPLITPPIAPSKHPPINLGINPAFILPIANHPANCPNNHVPAIMSQQSCPSNHVPAITPAVVQAIVLQQSSSRIGDPLINPAIASWKHPPINLAIVQLNHPMFTPAIIPWKHPPINPAIIQQNHPTEPPNIQCSDCLME